MFPIRDHNPSGRTPYVVYALIIANALVFFGTAILLPDGQVAFEMLMNNAIVPARFTSEHGLQPLITSLFLHGGFMHLAGNMLFLWIFGDNLEGEMGHLGFLAFYLVCGAGAGLIHVMSAPGSMVPTIGASGAIAGVMGGYLLLFPKARVDILLILIVFFKIFPVPAWVMLLLWLGMQFLGGVGSNPDTGGVAYWAHVGGFAVGLAFTIPLWLRRGGTSFWNRTHGHPPHPEHIYSPSRIPRIPRK